MPDILLQFLSKHPWLEAALWSAGLIFTAFIISLVIRKLLLRGSDRLITRFDRGQNQDIRAVVRHIANIAPALVFSLGISAVPHLPPAIVTIVQNVAHAFIIFTITLAIASAFNAINSSYERRPQSRLRPIKGLMQIAKIILFAIATILILATLVDRSPLILLSGLGAMAAVLMLVFQDTLLSLVAGIQISTTDMVRVGDWIEIPSVGADGDVIEIALHTVKVRNFDKTITTVPIRKLVTDSVKNWRGMQETGGRRIKRSIYIDQQSITFLDEKDKKRLARYRLLEDYMKTKQAEIDGWNKQLGAEKDVPANTRRLTNIGTFRAYVVSYIRNHPGVHKDMTILVRQMAPGAEGLPLEIYCFTNTTAWNDYETIQSDIFDHLYSIMPEFGLRVFQAPSGADMQNAFHKKAS
ncbi:MAG: Mechanosensitive channel protein [Candidatus Tokpelaia hoelldobleri]|uniref:Mechanosensitive channel protein n=1 Tax=Candidatus Tokpelaia hoelldobleri TaxID=1902579 RepID=A0A1U9JUY8_9HYPH|nr:MAG: Mechanosensitive channel protein [Candidatus Tokpelaia hoelldoblerii]